MPAKQSPIVSIVMPVYNAERTVSESINSILNQTFTDFELIICNDASTDDTNKIIRNFKDKRIRILQNFNNLGEGLSRDNAINKAKGKWIAVVDADDVWLSERLDVMLQNIDFSTQEMVMVFDDIMECHDTASGLFPWRLLRGKRAFGGNGIDSINVPIEKFIQSSRLLIKPLFPSRVVHQNNIRHSTLKFGADTDFFLKILSHGIKLRYIPKAMYYYRITPGSATSISNRSCLMRKILEEAIENFEHEPLFQEALQKKIATVIRDEKYWPFVNATKQGRYFEALKMTVKNPAFIIPEFLKRLWFSFYYHTHRIIHGGRTRGIK
jgi:glycosyltransferase involved in cell wall biosynthesis